MKALYFLPPQILSPKLYEACCVTCEMVLEVGRTECRNENGSHLGDGSFA